MRIKTDGSDKPRRKLHDSFNALNMISRRRDVGLHIINNVLYNAYVIDRRVIKRLIKHFLFRLYTVSDFQW